MWFVRARRTLCRVGPIRAAGQAPRSGTRFAPRLKPPTSRSALAKHNQRDGEVGAAHSEERYANARTPPQGDGSGEKEERRRAEQLVADESQFGVAHGWHSYHAAR